MSELQRLAQLLVGVTTALRAPGDTAFDDLPRLARELRQRVTEPGDPRIARYREALEELAKGGCISGHSHGHCHERCWDCYKQVGDWCFPCVAQYALDPWTGREAER